MRKSYEQMKKEFIELYNNENYGINKSLSWHNEERKVYAPIVFLKVFIINLSIIVFWIVLYGAYIKNYDLIFDCFLGWASIITILFPINYIYKQFVKHKYPNKSISIFYDSAESGNSDSSLKLDFMQRFVDIFFEYGQAVNYCYDSRYEPNISDNDIRNEKILNHYALKKVEDYIQGTFRDVNIKIYEINTFKLLQRIRNSVFKITTILFLTILILQGIPLYLFHHRALPITFPFLIILILGYIIYSMYGYGHFRGILITFDMNKNFSGHTFFHENSQVAKRIRFDKNKYKKLNLESVTFEKKYNAYSDDQIEGRYLLTPAFMDRIENLRFTFKAKYVRGSFKNNKLTLAIHTDKDMFAMGYDFKDSDYETFKELYDEMVSILQIVDELKLNEHTGL